MSSRPYLAYHEVCLHQDCKTLYTVTTHQFSEHLSSLKKLKTSEAVDVQITFDDGHVSNFEYAAPKLEELKVRGVFFVTAGWIGSRPGYMSWDHLRQLVSIGHSIQCHSWSHRFLTQCSPNELERELCWSKQTLEQRLGVTVDAISCPGGRWNRDLLRSCAAAGYRRFYHSDAWISEHTAMHGNIELLVAGRRMVTCRDTPKHLVSYCKRGTLELGYLKAAHRMKRIAKAVLGEGRYHRLWRTVAGRNNS